ncbi:hypothetical protein CUMW_031890 [Citrus unshiu]|nr:hypothetical protein CUMW_031890 [Citrus unshiu]
MNTISSSGCFGKFPGAIAGDNPADHVSSFFMTAFVRAPKPKLYFCLFYYEKLLEALWAAVACELDPLSSVFVSAFQFGCKNHLIALLGWPPANPE